MCGSLLTESTSTCVSLGSLVDLQPNWPSFEMLGEPRCELSLSCPGRELSTGL